MSFNVKEAFKTILRLAGPQEVTIERKGVLVATPIKIVTSNYFRDFSSVEEIPLTGNEFVVDYDDIVGTIFEATGIKRGDRIDTSIYGILMVEEIRPMIIFGTLVGYRIRTNK